MSSMASAGHSRLGRITCPPASMRSLSTLSRESVDSDRMDAGGHVIRPSRLWPAEAIEDIQTKAEIGRYRIRAYSTRRKTTHFDDLTFVPCTLSRVPLEGYRERCETSVT